MGGIYLGVQLLADLRGFRGFTPVTLVNSTSGWPASFELMISSCSVHSLKAMKRDDYLSVLREGAPVTTPEVEPGAIISRSEQSCWLGLTGATAQPACPFAFFLFSELSLKIPESNLARLTDGSLVPGFPVLASKNTGSLGGR